MNKFAVLLLLIILFLPSAIKELKQENDETVKLHKDALVWDCHSDLAYRILYEKLDIRKRLPVGHVDIPRMQKGNIDVQVMALWPDNRTFPRASARQTLQLLDAMLTALEQNSDVIELARTASDIERITGSGKIAAPISIEGGHAIEDDLGLLRCYHRLGVSSMTITHNKTHNWADSLGDEHKWGGLNEFGESVVREMNRIGMVIDCSHVSDETFYDVIGTSQNPVIFSHSGCRALCDHQRNVTDDMLRALAKNGGVIGIVTVLQYVTQEYRDTRRELSKISRLYLIRAPVAEDLDLQIALSHLRAGQDWPDENLPTVEDVLDHIDHAVKVAGVDHVGLGADMYPRTPAPIGLKDVTEYINITRGLKKRGYSEQDVKKIMGGNFLRVWREVTEKGR